MHECEPALVVGLGNPGPAYAATRHNVGFRVVERFAARHGIALDDERHGGRIGRAALKGRDVTVLEPWSWMNRSGASVASAWRALGLEDPSRELVVVFDDLDLPFGRLRVRPSGGAGGHRGMESVIDALGTRAFPRLRFGVGRPAEGRDPVEHVLEPFDPEEEEALPAHLEHAADALDTLLEEGVAAAMNRFNRRPDEGGEEEPS